MMINYKNTKNLNYPRRRIHQLLSIGFPSSQPSKSLSSQPTSRLYQRQYPGDLSDDRFKIFFLYLQFFIYFFIVGVFFFGVTCQHNQLGKWVCLGLIVLPAMTAWPMIILQFEDIGCNTSHGILLPTFFFTVLSTAILVGVKYSFQYIALSARRRSEFNLSHEINAGSMNLLVRRPAVENHSTLQPGIVDQVDIRDNIEMREYYDEQDNREHDDDGINGNDDVEDVLVRVNSSTPISVWRSALIATLNYEDVYLNLPVRPQYLDRDITYEEEKELKKHKISELDYRKWVNISTSSSSYATLDDRMKDINTILALRGLLKRNALPTRTDETPFMIFQFILSLVAIIWAVIDVDKTLPTWDIYTNMYGSLANSWVFSTIFSTCFPFYYDFKHDIIIEYRHRLQCVRTPISTFICNVVLIIMLPIICTHIIPGLFLYGWFMLFLLFPFCFVSFPILYLILVFIPYLFQFFRPVFFHTYLSGDLRGIVTAEILHRIFFILFIQQLTNAMSLFYSSFVYYNDVFKFSFSNLGSQNVCFFKHMSRSVVDVLFVFIMGVVKC